MRFTKILTLASALLFTSATAASAAQSGSDAVTVSAMTIAPSSLVLSVTQDPQPPKADVKVDISDQRTVWYMDPVWLALGAIALLIVIVLAVMAARGGGDRGGTTVVR